MALMGLVIDCRSVDAMRHAVKAAVAAGGEVVTGGLKPSTLRDEPGFYGLPHRGKYARMSHG
ncbi:MAG: hypothetical protein H6806_00810 [Planctomycetes bacterium]|nr:hypothetical protein [Planctomycetota bacterium]